MNNSRTLRAVQFLHGGQQAPVRTGTPAWHQHIADAMPQAAGYTPWNTGAVHYRKFMSANARLLCSLDARPKRSVIEFWGEWEPPSLADPVAEYIGGHGPRHIHRPVLAFDNREWVHAIGSSASSNNDCTNTDPFVFGDEFYYVCCHQKAFPTMRNLERGSVVLFGSRRDFQFVLDTVFVVADYLRWPEDRSAIEQRTPSTYHRATLDYLDASESQVLYIGATYKNPVHGMFSFVPCLPHSKTLGGFMRPVIRHSEAFPFISPRKTQGISTQLLTDLNQARHVWESVANVVVDAGLCLGFDIEMPIDTTL